MNQKPNKQLIPRKIQVLFISGILSMLVFVTCKVKDKKTESAVPQPQEQPVAKTENTSTLSTTLEDFPVLYTEFQNIVDIFSEAGIGLRRKIVFRFDFDGGEVNGQPTLSGFPARNNTTFPPGTSILTLQKRNVYVTLAYPLYLGNIELTRDEYRTLNSDASKMTYLVFTPVKSTRYPNVVVYTTAWSNTVQFTIKDLKPIKINAVGDELNPSPPKDPS